MVWSQIRVGFDASFDIRVGLKDDAKSYRFQSEHRNQDYLGQGWLVRSVGQYSDTGV